MLLRNSRTRAWVIQGTLIVALAAFAALIYLTTITNLERRGIPVGWDFLAEPSQVVVSESVLDHDPQFPAWRVIVVGLTNTLYVSALVIVLSTVAGLIVGLMRLGSNPLSRWVAGAWVEIARNFPPIVLLIFLYSLWWKFLPPVDQAGGWPGVIEVSMRGIALPGPQWELSPELATVVVGLTLYTTGFIAEIVRAGVLAIDKGQWEAGHALGLKRAKILRLVVIPQALRVIVPPMNSQYINVVKNSTLVIAVGYPDFLAVMNTLISKTSHSIEGVTIILAVYLSVNLALSLLANWYNSRLARTAR